MDIRHLISQGADETFLQYAFNVERYAWLALSYDMAAVVGMSGNIDEVNSAWERATGYKKDELIEKYLLEFMHFDDRERALAEMQSMNTSDMATASFEFRFLCKDGSYKRLNWNVIFSPEHEQFYCVVKDVSELSHQEAVYAAYHDQLTGLGNRLYLTDTLPGLISEAAGNDSILSLMFLDLDGFKEVNDTLGHSSGDLLLQEVADRLKKASHSPDFTIRLGGDEFVVIMKGMKTRDEVETAATKIVETISAPVVLDGQKVEIGVSIGISTVSDSEKSSEEFLNEADTAMYHVKKTGKNSYCFFQDMPKAN